MLFFSVRKIKKNCARILFDEFLDFDLSGSTMPPRASKKGTPAASSGTPRGKHARDGSPVAATPGTDSSPPKPSGGASEKKKQRLEDGRLKLTPFPVQGASLNVNKSGLAATSPSSTDRESFGLFDLGKKIGRQVSVSFDFVAGRTSESPSYEQYVFLATKNFIRVVAASSSGEAATTEAGDAVEEADGAATLAGYVQLPLPQSDVSGITLRVDVDQKVISLTYNSPLADGVMTVTKSFAQQPGLASSQGLSDLLVGVGLFSSRAKVAIGE